MTVKIIVFQFFFFTATINFPMDSIINLKQKNFKERIQPQQKHIIFDAEFIIQTNQKKALKKLGMSSLSSFSSGVFTREDALKEFLKYVQESTIELNNNNEHSETVYLENQKIPHAMVGWLKNKIQSSSLLEQVTSYIKEKNTFFTRPTTIATIALDPSACVKVLTINKEIYELIKELKEQGHVIHILGNWNSAMRKNFKEHFSQDLKIINGTFLVSGDLEEVKCTEHAKIYEKFLECNKVSSEKAYFVETWDIQKTYATIIAKPTDIESLRQELQNKQLLKK